MFIARRPRLAPPPSCIVPVLARALPEQVGELERRRLALDALVEATAATGERDGADRGDQQQVGGDLERCQEARQQQPADLRGRAEAGDVGRAVVADRLQARAEHGDEQLDRQRRAAGERPERRDAPRVLADRRRGLAPT